jgi:hypothetical protein
MYETKSIDELSISNLEKGIKRFINNKNIETFSISSFIDIKQDGTKKYIAIIIYKLKDN